MAWVLWIALGLVTAFWALTLAVTVFRRATNPYRIRANSYPQEATPGSPSPVTVVIPARNEQDNIERCVRSVLEQDYPAVDVVVLDDASTDATAEILAKLAGETDRLRVLGGSELPAGWKGKCWALQQAQKQAGGDWLLFLDADVVLGPEAVRQAMAYVAEHDLHMLSGYGKLVLGSFWEKVVMPVVGGLIVAGNPLEEVNDPDHHRAIANGQFILVERAAYDEIGQHEAIASEIIDDVALARTAKEKGIRYHMVFCRELFSTRMYTTLGQIWEGWRKNLYAGVGYRPGVAAAVLLFTLYTSLGPFAALALPTPYLWLGLVAVGLVFANRIYTAILFEHPPHYAITHPLGALVVAGILGDSALRGMRGGKVTWKGRAYDAGSADPPSP